MHHPNLESSEQSSDVDEKQAKHVDFAHSRFTKWFINFDENKLKPFLIYNYSETTVHTLRRMHTILNEDGAIMKGTQILDVVEKVGIEMIDIHSSDSFFKSSKGNDYPKEFQSRAKGDDYSSYSDSDFSGS